MKDSLKLFLVTGLCSFSTLAYEILLTRIFSISLWYHFAFMIVSIAMLGLAAQVRSPKQSGWYFKVDSIPTSAEISKSPTYPTQTIPKFIAKL